MMKAANDGRANPWKEIFAGQEINEAAPKKPDFIVYDVRTTLF